MLSGRRAARPSVNLTLGEAVCYKFSFPTCAAASTVGPQGDKARAF